MYPRPGLTVGPILGCICQRCTRVLFETNTTLECTLVVTPLDNSETSVGATNIVHSQQGRPTVFNVVGLLPGKYAYTITCKDGRPDAVELARSYFVIPTPTSPISTLVVSCNAQHLLKPNDINLWDSIARRHDPLTGTQPADTVLHIGDQIYEDTCSVWERSYKYMTALQCGNSVSGKILAAIDTHVGQTTQWQTTTQYTFDQVIEGIKEMYRDLYRQQWTHPAIREVLSKFSNSMILDDHDIRNGWGILDEDRTATSIEYQLGFCAWEIYKEYQVQLWRPIDDHFRVDFRLLKRGDTGTFILDVRNPRTFCYNSSAPYVGEEQFKALKAVLQDVELKKLIVVCSVPIVLASKAIMNVASHVDITHDLRDHWSQGEHAQDQFRLLDMLAQWKRVSSDRQLLLVGGDIHMGLASTVHDHDNFLCEQVITSPITNEPTTGVSGWLQDVIFQKEFCLHDRFKVQHEHRIHARNYAHIQVTRENEIAGFSNCSDWNYRFYVD